MIKIKNAKISSDESHCLGEIGLVLKCKLNTKYFQKEENINDLTRIGYLSVNTLIENSKLLNLTIRIIK